MTEAATQAAGTQAVSAEAIAAAGQGQAAQGQQAAAQTQQAQAAAGGNDGAKWYAGSGLDPAIEQRIHTRGYKSWADVAKAEFNQAELIGKKGVIVPGENDPPERWAEYHKAIGAVEAPDKIEIPYLEGAKPSEFEQRMEKAMRPAFAKAGLTQRQINVLVKEGYHEFAKGELAGIAQSQQQAQQQGETEIAALRQELGPKADAYIATAQRAARALLGKDPAFAGDLDKLLGAGRFVRLMGTIGEQFFREGSPALNAGGGGYAMTKEQAVVEIAKLNGDRNVQAILQDKQHPEYRVMVQKRDELYRIAYPEPAV